MSDITREDLQIQIIDLIESKMNELEILHKEVEDVFLVTWKQLKHLQVSGRIQCTLFAGRGILKWY